MNKLQCLLCYRQNQIDSEFDQKKMTTCYCWKNVQPEKLTTAQRRNINMDREMNEEEYRNKIIRVCYQEAVRSFYDEYPQSFFHNFIHLDSGSYSSVVKCFSLLLGKEIVLKIIKLNVLNKRKRGLRFYEDSSDGEPNLIDEHYCNVFQEILISKALSNLHSNLCNYRGYEFRTHCFPKVYKTSLVDGTIPTVKKINTHNEYIAICMENCGISLRNAIKDYNLNVNQIESICYQILLGLIIAEIMYEYEHRDLHISNIMVRKTSHPQINYMIRSDCYTVHTHGIRAFIIDNTFSRMRVGDNVYFTHLSAKLDKIVKNSRDVNKQKKMTHQDWVYVKMFYCAKNNWQKWMPETNTFWVQYIIEWLLEYKYIKMQMLTRQETYKSLKMLADRISHCKYLQEVLKLIEPTNKI